MQNALITGLVLGLCCVMAICAVAVSADWHNYTQLETAKVIAPSVAQNALALSQQNKTNAEAGLTEIFTAILVLLLLSPLVATLWILSIARLGKQSQV